MKERDSNLKRHLGSFKTTNSSENMNHSFETFLMHRVRRWHNMTANNMDLKIRYILV